MCETYNIVIMSEGIKQGKAFKVDKDKDREGGKEFRFAIYLTTVHYSNSCQTRIAMTTHLQNIAIASQNQVKIYRVKNYQTEKIKEMENFMRS